MKDTIYEFYMLHKQGRFTAMEGIRGWAVIMVFHVHFFKNYYADWLAVLPAWLHQVVNTLMSGHIGVDLFFILSGFLIYHTITRNQPGFFQFLGNRYRRLLPVIIITALPFIMRGMDLKSVIDNIFFFNLFRQSEHPNIVTWSLTLEEYFYLFIAIWMLIYCRRMMRSWRVILTIALICLLVPFFTKFRPMLLLGNQMPRFLGFFWGIALAKLVSEHERIKTHMLAKYGWLLGVLMIFGLRWYVGQTGKNVTYWGTVAWRTAFFGLIDLGFFLILLSILTHESPLKKVFSWAPLRMVGNISFSFYMIHCIYGLQLANHYLSRRLSGMLRLLLLYLGAFAVTFILSSFMFHYLEKPYLLRKSNKKIITAPVS